MKKKKHISRKILFTLLAVLVTSFLVVNCSGSNLSVKETKMENRTKSSIKIKDKFYNYVPWNEPKIGESMGTMWDFLFKKNNRKPNYKIPRQEADLQYFNSDSENHLSSTWLGHSSLMINIDGFKILTDPVFEKSVTFLFGPSRYNGKLPVDPNKIKNVDVVLISHNHYDHLNEFSIKLLNRKVKKFIVPLKVKQQLIEWRIPENKIVELDWWEEIKIGNVKIAFTPTQHFSGRGLFDRNETLWGSYVVETNNHKIYFSGDSGYSDNFKAIGDKYGPFDLAFMECGAYNEKWHHIHMYPEESIQASLDLNAKLVQPIHWGTFDLSLHAWFDPMERAVKAAENNGVKLVLPIVGGTTVLGEIEPTEKWWRKNNKILADR